MGGRLELWYHIYNPYEQQKIYRQIILFQRIYYLSISLTSLPCHREPSIVLMSMVEPNRVSWYCLELLANDGMAKRNVYIYSSKKRVSMGIITEIIVKFCIGVVLAIICKSPYLIKRTTIIANGIFFQFWEWYKRKRL